MSKINDAIARITDECEGKDYLIPFEEYLTGICTSDEIADKILNPKKTLDGCFENMKGIAKKRAVKGAAYIPPEEGFQIIRDYYGIELRKEKKAAVIDVMDLL